MRKRKTPWMIYGIAGLFIGYLGYLMADAVKRGGDLLQAYPIFMQNLSKPFENYWNEYSIEGIAIVCGIWIFFVLMKELGRKNYMPGREYGTAKWGDPLKISKELADHNDTRQGNIRVRK